MPATPLVVQVVGLVLGLWLLARLPGCWRAPPVATSGTVSLVIPARNEAASLPALLASLRSQSAPATEVVVVDDDSRDETAVLAVAGGARLISVATLPNGWTGKSWACWTGAQATAGDLLIFLDADTRLVPDGLERLVAEHRASGGLLSVQPFHRCVRPVESLSALFNVVSMMGVAAFSPLGARRPAMGAFGPCLVTWRRDYERSGGHRAVGDAVLDDVELARRYRQVGLPVRCLAGKHTVEFRMYPDGGRPLLEGWTKNFAKGARASPLGTSLQIFVWITALLSCAGALLGAALAFVLGHHSTTRLIYFAVAYVGHGATLAWMLSRIGRFRWWAWALWPVGLAVFMMVFVRSLARTATGRPVRWKGRWVATTPSARRRTPDA